MAARVRWGSAGRVGSSTGLGRSRELLDPVPRTHGDVSGVGGLAGGLVHDEWPDHLAAAPVDQLDWWTGLARQPIVAPADHRRKNPEQSPAFVGQAVLVA